MESEIRVADRLGHARCATCGTEFPAVGFNGRRPRFCGTCGARRGAPPAAAAAAGTVVGGAPAFQHPTSAELVGLPLTPHRSFRTQLREEEAAAFADLQRREAAERERALQRVHVQRSRRASRRGQQRRKKPKPRPVVAVKEDDEEYVDLDKLLTIEEM